MNKTILAVVIFGLLFSCQKEKEKSVDTSKENNAGIPYADPEFKGTIAATIEGSKADYPMLTRAPNVLIILLDDVGFGQTSTFGGPVQTPTLESIILNSSHFDQRVRQKKSRRVIAVMDSSHQQDNDEKLNYI